MLRSIEKYVVLALVLLAFASCKKNFEGDAKPQAPPETFMVVDNISRTGDLRYTTTIEAHWWGASETGTIKGFEVSIDNQQSWKFMTQQHGTFLLELPIGSDTADIAVFVRSIDNLDQRDPSPASTAYPIRNTPPAVLIDYSFGRKATTFPAFRLYWSVTDTDGVDDIQGIEVAFNDTSTFYTLPGNTTAASFVAEVSGGVISNSFLVYQNARTTPEVNKISGIIYNQYNTYYVRAFDRTGSKSKWSAADSILVKKPVSSILLVNDYHNAPGQVQNFYTTRITNLGAPYNVYDAISSLKDEMPTDNFTCIKAFSFFDRLVWYSDDAYGSLAFAQENTGQFFSAGGRMLMAVEFGGDFPVQSNLLDFLPVQALVFDTSGGTIRMNTDALMTPYHSASTWPTMKSSSIVSSARAFFVPAASSGIFSYDSLYKADLISQNASGINPWTGNPTVMAVRRKNSTGKSDIIFTSLPLHKLNANNNADALFSKMLITELGF